MKLSETAMWKAVVARDKTFDGRFIYAVKTTAIYCRPTCPSRRPNKDNVLFFDNIEDAQKSGFRACARCQPDASRSKNEIMVEKVREYIEGNLDEPLTLQKIGSAVGVSPFHMQRIFKAETGLTPREYADECRLSTVKKELTAGRQVTEALYEAGYGSSSRLYERSSQQLGMTPGSYKKQGAGETVNFAFVQSELGLLLMGATKRGLCFLQFGDSEEQLMNAISTEFSAAAIVENHDALANWINGLIGYMNGKKDILDVPVDMRGTTFQQAVWRYLRQIPAGETRTYTEVAEAIGKPRAVRAVASAIASNHVAMIIPCHRVIRQDGTMGGYRWGLDRKEALLAKEKP